jgi:hypothetical protein
MPNEAVRPNKPAHPNVKVIRVALVPVLLLAGCATTGSVQPTIVEADERSVAECSFLLDTVGSSMLGIAFSRRSVANAKEAALKDARAAGATHVVWQAITPPTVSAGATVHGKAYRCH